MPAIKTETSANTTGGSLPAFNPAAFLNLIEILHGRFQTAIYTSFIAALLMSSVILKLAPGQASLDWLILFTIITGLRVYFGLVRINHRLSINSACEWYGYFLLGSFVSGGLWCYLGLSLIPGLQVQAIDYVFLHAMNVLFIAGLTANAMFAFRRSMLAILAFSLPAVVPYAVYLAVQANPYLPMLGTVFLIIYLFMILSVMNHCQKQVLETGTASKTVQH